MFEITLFDQFGAVLLITKKETFSLYDAISSAIKEFFNTVAKEIKPEYQLTSYSYVKIIGGNNEPMKGAL